MKEKSLYTSLLNIQSAIKAPKNQVNIFGKYKYRSCEDILEALKPLLLQEECTLTLSDELVMIGERYYIKAIAQLISGKGVIEVCAYAREEETKKGMDGSQITGTSSSYARKYALNGMFLIDDTKDSDATNQHGKEEVKKELPLVLPKSDEKVKEVNEKLLLSDSQKAVLRSFMSEFEEYKDPKNFVSVVSSAVPSIKSLEDIKSLTKMEAAKVIQYLSSIATLQIDKIKDAKILELVEQEVEKIAALSSAK